MRWYCFATFTLSLSPPHTIALQQLEHIHESHRNTYGSHVSIILTHGGNVDGGSRHAGFFTCKANSFFCYAHLLHVLKSCSCSFPYGVTALRQSWLTLRFLEYGSRLRTSYYFRSRAVSMSITTNRRVSRHRYRFRANTIHHPIGSRPLNGDQ